MRTCCVLALFINIFPPTFLTVVRGLWGTAGVSLSGDSVLERAGVGCLLFGETRKSRLFLKHTSQT